MVFNIIKIWGTTNRNLIKLILMEHLNTEVPFPIKNLYHNYGTGSSEMWPTGRIMAKDHS